MRIYLECWLACLWKTTCCWTSDWRDDTDYSYPSNLESDSDIDYLLDEFYLFLCWLISLHYVSNHVNLLLVCLHLLAQLLLLLLVLHLQVMQLVSHQLLHLLLRLLHRSSLICQHLLQFLNLARVFKLSHLLRLRFVLLLRLLPRLSFWADHGTQVLKVWLAVVGLRFQGHSCRFLSDWFLCTRRNWLDFLNFFLHFSYFFGLCCNSIFCLHVSSIVHVLDDGLLSEREVWFDTSPPLLCWIVCSSFSTVQIVVSLHPLDELQVVLVLRFWKFLNLMLCWLLLRRGAWCPTCRSYSAILWSCPWTRSRS